MKRIYILSTCDDWKSRGSMIRYYVGSSDKAGTRRMLAAIKKRYQGAYFSLGYEWRESSGAGADRRLSKRCEVCGCYSCV